MSSIGDWFTSVIAEIKALPLKIGESFLEALKTLFIPSEEYLNDTVERLKYAFLKLGVSNFDMSALFSSETPLSDITVNIAGQEVVIVRMSLVEVGVLKFRAIIRGFIVLLMLLYNYNQFMLLIGGQPISLGSHVKESDCHDIRTVD